LFQSLFHCFRNASWAVIRRLRAQGYTTEYIRTNSEEIAKVPLTQEDFLDTIQKVSPSVGKQDLVKYEQWMKEFGST